MALSKLDLKQIAKIIGEAFDNKFDMAFDRKFDGAFDKAFDRKFDGAFDRAFDRKFDESFNRTFNDRFPAMFDYKIMPFERRLTSLEELVKHLPTRNEFLTWMDKLVTQNKRIEEEQVFMNEQVRRNSRDIDKLKLKA